MEKIKLILIFLLPIYLSGQNLIQNGSFEDCDIYTQQQCQNIAGTPTCSNVPYERSQFVHVANWKSVCSVDWYYDAIGFYDITVGDAARHCNANEDINAHTGTHYIGMYNQEAIIYDLGSNLANGYYKLEFWAKSCEGYKIEIFGSDDAPEKDDDCSIKVSSGKHLYSLYSNAFAAQSNWQLITVDFDVFSKDVRYITITGNAHGYGCSEADYFFIDDVSMTKQPCCPPSALFQYFSITTSTTEREHYIRAGADVGAHGQTGPVNINDGNTVSFRAGDFISIEPGFIVHPGAVFTAEIGPCEDLTDKTTSIFILPDAYNGITEPWCIKTVNAITWEIEVVGRYGETHTYSGVVSEDNWICLDVDFQALCMGMWELEENGVLYIAYITLHGCSSDLMIQTDVTAVCPHDYKTDVDLEHKGSVLSIQPNPFNDNIVAFYPVAPLHEVTVSKIFFFDMAGRLVKEINAIPTEGKVHINTTDFSSGVYVVKVYYNDQVITKRIVKTSN